jgi:hypothetical protein
VTPSVSVLRFVALDPDPELYRIEARQRAGLNDLHSRAAFPAWAESKLKSFR